MNYPKMMSRYFPIVVLAGLGAILTASAVGQTAAPVPPATGQIGPGSTGSIDHGVSGVTGDKPHKILDGALTPATRETLQKAMNSPAAAATTK
jgi:hypothetical protein